LEIDTLKFVMEIDLPVQLLVVDENDPLPPMKEDDLILSSYGKDGKTQFQLGLHTD